MVVIQQFVCLFFYINLYILNIFIYRYIPGTNLSFVLGSKRMPFPIKTRVIWVPGVYIYILPGSLTACP